MATRAAERPAGKISEVFYRDSERQGAYDFLESGHVDASSVLLAMGQVTARAAAAESVAFVAIDGASITLTDRDRRKGFGPVGTKGDARGVKVINALGPRFGSRNLAAIPGAPPEARQDQLPFVGA
jgi:hypothetical protein